MQLLTNLSNSTSYRAHNLLREYINHCITIPIFDSNDNRPQSITESKLSSQSISHTHYNSVSHRLYKTIHDSTLVECPLFIIFSVQQIQPSLTIIRRSKPFFDILTCTQSSTSWFLDSSMELMFNLKLIYQKINDGDFPIIAIFVQYCVIGCYFRLESREDDLASNVNG